MNNPLKDLNPIDTFESYMDTFEKVYQNSEELLSRMQIFNRNNDFIKVTW